MRKHIAKALQACSKAICTALECYNVAVQAQIPPRPQLTWTDVVEYAFLADFDLLRDARQDIRQRPWTRPACRLAMDTFFTIEHAHEEIKCLNLEIPRVVTFMHDEDIFLRIQEDSLRVSAPGLAHQIKLHRLDRSRFTNMHMRRFRKLARMEGFSGSIKIGVSVEDSMRGPVEGQGDDSMRGPIEGQGDDEGMKEPVEGQGDDDMEVDIGPEVGEQDHNDSSDDEDDEQDDEQLSALLVDILQVVSD
jgi:hypothetical protein